MPNKVAIIVPFRDLKEQERMKQLKRFIPYMCKFLDKSNLDYNIFVIEQSDDGYKFNAGQTKNIGFHIAKRFNYDYYIFHDVDLLPNNDLMYGYERFPDIPTGMAGMWDKYKYYPNGTRIPDFIGGIFSIAPKDFEAANGYPSNHWGWSKDDSILLYRLKKSGITVDVLEKGSLEEMKHKHGRSKREWENILYGMLEKDDEITWKYNGLYNLEYKILEKKNFINKKCFKIKVKLSDPDGMAEVNNNILNNHLNIYNKDKIYIENYVIKLKKIKLKITPNVSISTFPAVYEYKLGFNNKSLINLALFNKKKNGLPILSIISPYDLVYRNYNNINLDISKSPENYNYINYFKKENKISSIALNIKYNNSKLLSMLLTMFDIYNKFNLVNIFNNKINILNINQNINSFGVLRNRYNYNDKISNINYDLSPKNIIKYTNNTNKYEFIELHIIESKELIPIFKEQTILQKLLANLLIVLKIQKNNGVLVLNSSYFRTNIGIQLLYIISGCYNDVYMIRPRVNTYSNGHMILIASNFNGIDNNNWNKLFEIFKTCYTYDPYFTKMNSIDNTLLHDIYPMIGFDLYANNNNYLNAKIKNHNNFITNILNIDYDNEWLNNLVKFNKHVTNLDNQYFKLFNMVYYWWKWKDIDFPGSIDNLIESSIKYQITNGMKFCNENKIIINPVYNSIIKIEKQINSIKQIKSLKNKNILFMKIPDLGIGNIFFIISTVYIYCIKNKLKLLLIVTNKTNYHISKNINFKELSLFIMPNLVKYYLDYSEYRKYVDIKTITRKSLSPNYNYKFKDLNLNKKKLPILLRPSYFQSYKYFNNYKKQILNLFDFPDSVKNYIDNKYINYNFNNIISLHVRHGDMLKEVLNNNNIFYILSLNYYINAINLWVKENKKYKILIFTDDADKWINSQLFPFLHKKNIEFEIVKNNSHIMDLYLMTKCKNFILSNSTYSWWGAYLSDSPNTVYCPKYFLNPEHEQPDIYLPDWKIVDCNERCYLKNRKEILNYL